MLVSRAGRCRSPPRWRWNQWKTVARATSNSDSERRLSRRVRRRAKAARSSPTGRTRENGKNPRRMDPPNRMKLARERYETVCRIH